MKGTTPTVVTSNNLTSIFLGSDPEIFVRRAGTKECIDPSIIPDMQESRKKTLSFAYGQLALDGLALEMHPMPTLYFNSAYYIADLRRTVSSFLNKNGYEAVVEPVVFFNKEYYDNEVASASKILGCNPDFNAYRGLNEPNPRPHVFEDSRGVMRTGGGHIHIGWRSKSIESLYDLTDEHYLEDCVALVRNLDAFFGEEEKTWDKNEERRRMYGALGSFRPKQYGLEYRPLSNAWLKLSIAELDRLFNNVAYITAMTMEGYDLRDMPRLSSGLVDVTRMPMVSSPRNSYQPHACRLARVVC